MSLRGRYVIDRVKKSVGSYFRLPVPPYADPSYWEAAYRSFGPEDCYEWGDVSLPELMEYEYQPIQMEQRPLSGETAGKKTSTLGNALGVQPSAENDEPLLMLGCGNSRLGEQMIQDGGWRGPIIQVDVSSRVVEAMTQRCGPLIENGHMNFVQDDAAELSAFRNGMVHACLDKGLMDAVYCADDHEQCSLILKSVNRVLKPGGVFVFLSFSRPHFMLPKIVDMEWRSRNQWDSIEVQELPSIMLYRFQKSMPVENVGPRRLKPKRSKRR